jgi:hypothetical protein
MAPIQACFDREARLGGRVTGQADDHLVVDEGAPAPVLGDVTEEPVLNLVPLARAWREVAHVHPDARVVREALQFDLPCPCSVAIAPAT